MKTIGYIASGLFIFTSLIGHAQDADQNPNWKNSADKYAAQSDVLIATQSTTPQDTYEAYDWREAKDAAKQQRLDRRYDLRSMRIQSRYRMGYPNYGYHNNSNWNNGYYNNGYYNNGYNNWNNGYNNNGYNNWNNGYYNNGFSGGSNLNSFLWGAGLGLGVHYLFH